MRHPPGVLPGELLMRDLARSFLAAGLLAGAAAAQTGAVLVVDDDAGPGVAHTDLQAAADAASDGDVLLVCEGEYGGLEIAGKTLLVQAEEDQLVTLTGAITVRDLAADQYAMLRELVVRESAEFPQFSVDLRDNAGPVWLESITVNPDAAVPFYHRFGVGATDCVSVTMVRCDVTAAVEAGVYSVGSTVSIWDSTVRGGTFGGGAAGVRVEGGSLYVSGASLLGGDGAPGAPNEIDGGDGVEVHGTGTIVRVLDSTLLPGAGAASTHPPGSIGVDGTTVDDQGASTVVEELAGAHRSIEKNSPVREQEIVTEVHTGEPFDLVFLIFSFGQAPLAHIPDYSGPFCIGSPFTVRNRGLLDATGFKSKDVTLQRFPPGIESIVFYNQVLHVDLVTLEAWLSSPTCSVHVAASF